MKISVLICVIITACSAFGSCPELSGIYTGECKAIFWGKEETKGIVIALMQKECDKFVYNEFGTNRYYTLNKSTLYIEGNTKYLRSAWVADEGSTLFLKDNIVEKLDDGSEALSVGNMVFKKLDDQSISYASERYDLIKNEPAILTSCPLLKKRK